MIQEFDIRVAPQTAATEANLREWLVREKNLQAKDITGTRILKRSIDARQRQVWVQLRVRVYLNEPPEQQTFPPIEYPEVRTSKEVIVVGAGPAGLFAALRLLELGIRPIVVERGKNVRDRKKDLAQISRNHRVDPESNYSFGEGGAGAYSDGKLYTRRKKRGNVEKILQVFCQFGASPSILIDAHPHIGTDKLPGIIEAMRNQILSCGGEVHFETRMEDLILHVMYTDCCFEKTSDRAPKVWPWAYAWSIPNIGSIRYNTTTTKEGGCIYRLPNTVWLLRLKDAACTPSVCVPEVLWYRQPVPRNRWL